MAGDTGLKKSRVKEAPPAVKVTYVWLEVYETESVVALAQL